MPKDTIVVKKKGSVTNITMRGSMKNPDHIDSSQCGFLEAYIGYCEELKADGQVVLLDMKLKGVSGLDILKEIRVQYPHLPVVLVTGYREEMSGAVEAALKISAYTCLYKPFEIEELLQLLGEIRRQEMARILGRPVGKRKQD